MTNKQRNKTGDKTQHLSPFLLVSVSVFCFLLSPFLLGVPLISLLFPSCWSLCPPCLPSFRLPVSMLVLSPFLLIIVFALSPLLSPFLLVMVSLVFILGPSCLPSVSFCLPSCPRSCSSLCLVSLFFRFVSLLVGHCVPCLYSWWSLCPSCVPSVSICLRSSLPLVDNVSKSGLGNASLLSHLFGVYGGVIYTNYQFNLTHIYIYDTYYLIYVYIYILSETNFGLSIYMHF